MHQKSKLGRSRSNLDILSQEKKPERRVQSGATDLSLALYVEIVKSYDNV